MLLWSTMGLGHTARLIPEKVIIPTLFLLSIQFVFDLVPRLSEKFAALTQLRLPRVEQLSAEAREKSIEEALGSGHTRRMLSNVLWFCSVPVLIYLLGLTIAAPLYTLIYLRGRCGERWRTSVLLAAAMGGLVLGVFGLILGVTFDEGYIWKWLRA